VAARATTQQGSGAVNAGQGSARAGSDGMSQGGGTQQGGGSMNVGAQGTTKLGWVMASKAASAPAATTD